MDGGAGAGECDCSSFDVFVHIGKSAKEEPGEGHLLYEGGWNVHEMIEVKV